MAPFFQIARMAEFMLNFTYYVPECILLYHGVKFAVKLYALVKTACEQRSQVVEIELPSYNLVKNANVDGQAERFDDDDNEDSDK